MSEFKKGDRVRIVREFESPHLKSVYDGMTGTIEDIFPTCTYKYFVRLDDGGYATVFYEVEHLKKYPVIVITTDGVTTTATKRFGKKVLGTAYSKCAPADTFDYDTGVGLALARLCGFKIQIHEEEPKFPEKLVCVKANAHSDYTPGKVYETIESKDPDFTHRVQGNDIGATWGIVEDGNGGYEVNVSKDITFWASFIPFVED